MSTKLWQVRHVLALAEHDRFTRNSLLNLVPVRIVGARLALVAVIVLGSVFCSFQARTPARFVARL